MKVYSKNDVDVTFSNWFMDLEQLTSFDAISLEKVKQAEEEIKSISQEVPYRNQAFNYGISICKTDKVLEILDKLIAESEG